MNYGWLLILSLPTENATVRMRAWRALKASGAAVMRDGVYLLPELGANEVTLRQIADDVRAGGGTASLLRTEEPTDSPFATLFDRSTDYGALMSEMERLRLDTDTASLTERIRQARKLNRRLEQLRAVDFFPGEAQRQAQAVWQALNTALQRQQSPDEPSMAVGDIAPCSLDDFQDLHWATRRRPKVDRLASAWLIRRFIDPGARFRWLASPGDLKAGQVGFDFDGARFTHTGHKVTFEVLIAAFGLECAALARLGAVVHFLDVGGVQPPEATGLEAVLDGLRATWEDDDQLLEAACGVLDGLYASFEASTIAERGAP